MRVWEWGALGTGGAVNRSSRIPEHQNPELTLLVDLVHGSEIIHVLQIYIHLENFLPRRACSLEYVSEISNALRLYPNC